MCPCGVLLSQKQMKLKLYHGTSLASAQQIQTNGFVPSSGGCLGPGIYFAREDKARRFAADASRHGGAVGGLIEVIVTIRNAKYVNCDDLNWQAEGYDACRTDHTSASPNMEWCIAHASQVKVIRVQSVQVQGTRPPTPAPVLAPAAAFSTIYHGFGGGGGSGGVRLGQWDFNPSSDNFGCMYY